MRPKTGTRVRPRRAWHLLDPDVVGWLFAGIERGVDLGDLRELHEVRATIETAAAPAAGRRTEAELSEIEAYERRAEAAWAEPLAARAADLDFHAAVVEAAHNGLLSHVSALIRVALEATDGRRTARARAPRRAAAQGGRRSPGPCAGDAEASEAAMRELVEHDWTRLSKGKI